MLIDPVIDDNIDVEILGTLEFQDSYSTQFLSWKHIMKVRRAKGKTLRS
jgi:hypothetical protein